MCGPPDFGALHTCIVHLGELSVAGLATYSACKTASLYQKLLPKGKKRDERALRDVPGGPVVECSSGHANT